MKVICIDASIREDDYCEVFVTEGEVYTVINECIGYGWDNKEYPCYELAEIPEPKHQNLFDCDRFIPLSEIDEMKLVKKEEIFA